MYGGECSCQKDQGKRLVLCSCGCKQEVCHCVQDQQNTYVTSEISHYKQKIGKQEDCLVGSLVSWESCNEGFIVKHHIKIDPAYGQIFSNIIKRLYLNF